VIRDLLPSPIPIKVIKTGQGRSRRSGERPRIRHLILQNVSAWALIQIAQAGGSLPLRQDLSGALLMPAIPIIEVGGVSELQRDRRTPGEGQATPLGNGNGPQLLAIGLGAALSDDHLDPLILPNRHPIISLLKEGDRRRWCADLDRPGKSPTRISRGFRTIRQVLHKISPSSHQ
jgi:hypothetical protein